MVVDGFRAFDYAFYLPFSTALACERIDFVSFIVITGSKCEWENDLASDPEVPKGEESSFLFRPS